MAIRFVCPSGHKLSAPESHAGKQARCPQCKQPVTIPNLPNQGGEAKPRPPVAPEAEKRPPKKPAPKPATQAKEPAGDPATVASGKGPLTAQAKPSLEMVPARPVDETPKPPSQKPPVPKKGSKTPPPLPSAGRKSAPDKTVSEPKQPDSEPSSKTDPPQKSTREERRAERRQARRDRRRGRRDRKRESADGDDKAPGESPEVPKRKRVRRQKRQGPQYMPADVYQADQGKIQTVRWLALILTAVVLFSLAPVVGLGELHPQDAAGWARLAVALGVLQLFFIVWMLNAPDWASVWVVMLVFAGVSTIYGMITAIVLATPIGEPMMLGMEGLRQQARYWCGAMLALMTMATYLCGRTASRWRRAFEAETARKISH